MAEKMALRCGIKNEEMLRERPCVVRGQTAKVKI